MKGQGADRTESCVTEQNANPVRVWASAID